MHRRLFLGLLAIFLTGQVACVDINKAGVGDTVLYVHQASTDSAKIQVFSDTNAVFTGTGDPTPTKTFTHSLIDGALPLAWGGMALDSPHKRLYLVGEKGTVVWIDRLGNQASGVLSDTDVHSFVLKSGDRLTGISTFGQAAYANDYLYVTETNDSGASQIWKISNPQNSTGGVSVALTKVELVSGDEAGTGLAVDGNTVYGFFNKGSNIYTPPASWTGPRLRKGTGDGFGLLGNAIGGAATLVGKYGSLAVDTSGNNLLYCARHNVDSSASGDSQPILVYKLGDFPASGGVNQAPYAKRGNGTGMNQLRVLAHAGKKDWLAALEGTGDTSFNYFWLWKEPSSGNTAVQKTLAGSGFRGVALDGQP